MNMMRKVDESKERLLKSLKKADYLRWRIQLTPAKPNKPHHSRILIRQFEGDFIDGEWLKTNLGRQSLLYVP